MKLVIRYFFSLFFILLCLLAVSFCYFSYHFLSYQNPKKIIHYIQKGDSVRAISEKLEEKKIIQSKEGFEVYLRMTQKAHLIKAGEYEFEAGLDFTQVIEKIISGKTKSYSFTIPEGLSIEGVCQILESKKIATREACRQASLDISLLKEAFGATSLEGYLFPETYTYDSQAKLGDILRNMVETFYKKIGQERELAARRQGLTLHQVVILASVVEKETGAAVERPLIAGVFANRIKIGMPLQSDPTVIYGIKDFNGNLTKHHLQTDTPYNTYTRKGLPVGPICNPGLAAIDAVLNPQATQALYFVAKGDGTHYFSESLDEHNRAVYQFQINHSQ